MAKKKPKKVESRGSRVESQKKKKKSDPTTTSAKRSAAKSRGSSVPTAAATNGAPNKSDAPAKADGLLGTFDRLATHSDGGRVSARDLASALAISKDAARGRLDRLVKAGTLTKDGAVYQRTPHDQAQLDALLPGLKKSQAEISREHAAEDQKLNADFEASRRRTNSAMANAGSISQGLADDEAFDALEKMKAATPGQLADRLEITEDDAQARLDRLHDAGRVAIADAKLGTYKTDDVGYEFADDDDPGGTAVATATGTKKRTSRSRKAK
jgi:predicted ArsR family transcriptional regulator